MLEEWLNNQWIMLPASAVLGLCFGSLITLLSYRLPRNLPVGTTRSRCPHCKAPLGPRDLIPLLSFLLARARCRHCGVDVSWRYPATEIATAVVFMLVYWLTGPTPHALALAGLSVCVITLIITDLEHYLIPDELQIAMAVLGASDILVTAKPWKEHLFAAAVTGGLALLLRVGYRWLRKKDGLGMGDVKLFAIAGLWLGLAPLPVFLFLSGILGVVSAILWQVLGRGKYFPFGPALALALWICVAFSLTLPV